MGRGGLDEEKRALLREMMLTDVDRLNEFIDDVLSASRLVHAADRAGLSTSPLVVKELVGEVAKSVCARYKLTSDAIEIDIDPALVIRSDPAALTVLLRNLLDNAVKYSDEGAVRVRIRARETDRGLAVDIEDSGIGIAKRDLKRVFHRFYRAPGESVRRRKGTGLGLFIVSGLIRSLGGRVEARSEGEGAGTTMTLTIPPGTRTTSPEAP